MNVIIAEIPKEGLEFDFKDEIVSDSILSPVNAHLKIEKLGDEVLVKGELTTEVHLQCGRCLKDFQQTLSVPVEVVYHPAEELKREENYEITNEELDTDFYTGEELDLFNILKEQIELNLPMKPLCNDSCKGLCPSCGKNLNSGNCKCSVKDTDPRFAALKQLIKERKEE